MARTYDPFDEEYEGVDPEPFGRMAQGYEQQQAQLREQRRIREEQGAYRLPNLAPMAPQAIPTTQTTLPSAPVNTFIGEGGGVGGRGGGRADDPTAFDDFGNLGDYGGGTYSPSTIRFEQARQGLAPLPQLAPMLPQATPTTLPPMATPATAPATTPTTTPTTAATAPAFPTAMPTAPTMAVPPTNLNLEQLGGGYGQFDPLVGSFINQFSPGLQSGAFMEPAPEVAARLQNLLTAGGRIPETMETYGAGLAGLPTGGAAPTQDLLSQFIAGNIGGANIPVQTAANQQLQNLMQGAGVSPQYAQAARETIFDPSMEAMQGRINKMGGGVADPTGGLSQELQRRHEQDFMNQMLMAGERNLPNYLQLGLAGGQQQFGQAAQAAGQAAQREQMIGAFGEQGAQQGLGFLNQMAQMRASQEDQLGALIRALLSGMIQPTPGILGTLVQSGIMGFPGVVSGIKDIIK
jgi:hypothetical protein